MQNTVCMLWNFEGELAYFLMPFVNVLLYLYNLASKPKLNITRRAQFFVDLAWFVCWGPKSLAYLGEWVGI